jgi:3'-phosphoadenosine 5'-phosphosulfate sulfotransferase (PAPS reductase)/FAD synthetase
MLHLEIKTAEQTIEESIETIYNFFIQKNKKNSIEKNLTTHYSLLISIHDRLSLKSPQRTRSRINICVARSSCTIRKSLSCLFSGGKDSIVVLHLALKAFYPASVPFTLLHVDTGHNFQEALDYRDNLVKKTRTSFIGCFCPGSH